MVGCDLLTRVGGMNKHEVWTADDVSAFLRIPKKTVYDLCHRKQLPHFKVGREFRFYRDRMLELGSGGKASSKRGKEK
jgi:excisionase family DNA binding protein